MLSTSIKNNDMCDLPNIQRVCCGDDRYTITLKSGIVVGIKVIFKDNAIKLVKDDDIKIYHEDFDEFVAALRKIRQLVQNNT